MGYGHDGLYWGPGARELYSLAQATGFIYRVKGEREQHGEPIHLWLAVLEKDESDLADWTADYKEGGRKPIIIMYDKVVLIMVKLLEKGYCDFLSISWLRSFLIPTYLYVKSSPPESS